MSTTANLSREEVQARLRATVANEGWDAAWKNGITPWDVGRSQPPLRDIIVSGRVKFPTEGTALVPGCGKGYDAVVIATQLGLHTTGIDISTTALVASNAYKQETGVKNVEFKTADFFTMDGSFDLIYDYTFFVAIPPSMRPAWGKKMTELVKPGGYLISLVFPIDPPVEHGPPYYVRPNHVLGALGEGWEKLIDEVPENSSEPHVGRESLLVLKRL